MEKILTEIVVNKMNVLLPYHKKTAVHQINVAILVPRCINIKGIT